MSCREAFTMLLLLLLLLLLQTMVRP